MSPNTAASSVPNPTAQPDATPAMRAKGGGAQRQAEVQGANQDKGRKNGTWRERLCGSNAATILCLAMGCQT